MPAVTTDTGSWPHTASMKIVDQQSDRAECKVAAEDGSAIMAVSTELRGPGAGSKAPLRQHLSSASQALKST